MKKWFSLLWWVYRRQFQPKIMLAGLRELELGIMFRALLVSPFFAVWVILAPLGYILFFFVGGILTYPIHPLFYAIFHRRSIEKYRTQCESLEQDLK
jgi:hypothetical protein